jgi:hypothetical protein
VSWVLAFKELPAFILVELIEDVLTLVSEGFRIIGLEDAGRRILDIANIGI